jgi:YD repeat-containing protein
MRWLLLGAVALLPCGCSVFVAQSGTDLSRFRTREQVHDYFGKPESEAVRGGAFEEVFVTREKFATDEMTQMADNPAYFLTLGLYELYAFPRELYYLGKRTTLGQELRFTFDGAGNTVRITRDNEDMRWLKFLGPDDNRRIVPAKHIDAPKPSSANTPESPATPPTRP